MNERERWIVYPLLFFALGAALRDKFLHQIRTDQFHARQISCEELVVLDEERPDRIVAKLTSGVPRGPDGTPAARTGVLVLIDSDNQELCGVTNNRLFVREIDCGTLRVPDPRNAQRTLAGLTSRPLAGLPRGQQQHFGVLELNNQLILNVPVPASATAPPAPGSPAASPSAAAPPASAAQTPGASPPTTPRENSPATSTQTASPPTPAPETPPAAAPARTTPAD